MECQLAKREILWKPLSLGKHLSCKLNSIKVIFCSLGDAVNSIDDEIYLDNQVKSK